MVTKEQHVQSVRAGLKDRALYMLYVYRELKPVVGEAEAEAVMLRATQELGRARARNLKLDCVRDFLAGVITQDVVDATRTEILTVDDDRATMRALYCPFVEAWRSSGASDEEILRLCRIVQHEDPAMVEHTGLRIVVPAVGEGKLICEGSGECPMEVREGAGEGRR